MLFRKRTDGNDSSPEPTARTILRDGISAGGGRTVIGARTRINGTVRGEGPMIIHGAVDGAIVLRGRLTVPSGGRISADVEAHSVDLAGEAHGTVRAAGRVLVSSTGSFEGEIATPVLLVQPGSIVTGRARVLGTTVAGRDTLSH